MLRIEMYKNRVVVKGNIYYISENVSDELYKLAKDMFDNEMEYREFRDFKDDEDMREIFENIFETCILEYLEEVA